jgi:hypothetical protein
MLVYIKILKATAAIALTRQLDNKKPGTERRGNLVER